MTQIELQELAKAIAPLVAELIQAEEVLDVHGAAKLLGVSPATIERRTRDGTLPSFPLGRLRRYRRTALLEYAHTEKQHPARSQGRK